MSNEKWHRRFLALAEHIAQWSKDPSTKVGAVIVDPDKRVGSLGYNGFPRGFQDLPERLENRDVKYKAIIHGERNALPFARGSVKGCLLYTWPFMPCSVCAGMVINAGISQVIAPVFDNPRWNEDMAFAKEIFEEAGVEVRLL